MSIYSLDSAHLLKPYSAHLLKPYCQNSEFQYIGSTTTKDILSFHHQIHHIYTNIIITSAHATYRWLPRSGLSASFVQRGGMWQKPGEYGQIGLVQKTRGKPENLRHFYYTESHKESVFNLSDLIICICHSLRSYHNVSPPDPSSECGQMVSEKVKKA